LNAGRTRDAAPGDPPAPRVAVLGLGNVLMADDAVGPWVVQRLLAAHEFPPEVSVQDLGTPGLDLSPFLAGPQAVVVVDTVASDGAPGELRLYRRAEILARPPRPRVSPHDPALRETLLTLELAGRAPREILVVGVIPARLDSEIGLSAAVRAALPAAERAVLDELERLGTPARPRPRPASPEVWWETVA
jgi:hydrogenase maturation protease